MDIPRYIEVEVLRNPGMARCYSGATHLNSVWRIAAARIPRHIGVQHVAELGYGE